MLDHAGGDGEVSDGDSIEDTVRRSTFLWIHSVLVEYSFSNLCLLIRMR